MKVEEWIKLVKEATEKREQLNKTLHLIRTSNFNFLIPIPIVSPLGNWREENEE